MMDVKVKVIYYPCTHSFSQQTLIEHSLVPRPVLGARAQREQDRLRLPLGTSWSLTWSSVKPGGLTDDPEGCSGLLRATGVDRKLCPPGSRSI